MEMDDETWHFIRQTVGVTGFLGQAAGTTSKPTPLQQSEVDNLLGRMGEAAPQPRLVLARRHRIVRQDRRVTRLAERMREAA